MVSKVPHHILHQLLEGSFQSKLASTPSSASNQTLVAPTALVQGPHLHALVPLQPHLLLGKQAI